MTEERKVPEQSKLEKQQKHYDHQEVFSKIYRAIVLVNYDTENDRLRRKVLSIINDISTHSDPTLPRILY
jgi:hypothetical protein